MRSCQCQYCRDSDRIERQCYAAIKLAEASKKAFEKDKERHPAVGAVILDQKGNVLAHGYRNEDRGSGMKGSHAEVVAFGCIDETDIGKIHTLITTLEPCSLRRRRDAISCARRTVYMGVKHVLIGCLDPGVGVRGHAAQLFQDRGIYVNLFPPQLHDLVKKYNREYLTPGIELKQDALPSFEIGLSNPECVKYLEGKEFQKYASSTYSVYKNELGGPKSGVEWKDYFASEALNPGILESEMIEVEESVKKRIRVVRRSVYSQLAAYLAVSPFDRQGKQDVYSRVGDWWLARNAHSP